MSRGSRDWSDPPTYEVEFEDYNRELVERLFSDMRKREETIRRVRESLRRKRDRWPGSH